MLGATPAFAATEPAPAADAVVEEEPAGPPRIQRDSLYPDWQETALEANRWIKAGDMMMLANQPEVAYPYYLRLATVAPRHSSLRRVAKWRGNSALRQMRNEHSMPPKENVVKEAWDLLTW